MESIVLGFVLFSVCFCAMSCLLYSGQVHSIASEIKSEPIEQQIREMFEMIDEELTTLSVKTVEHEPLEEMVSEEVNHKDLIEALNLDKLPLRKARPVAKALDIRQKVNGKDAPVKWLRVQIRQKLEENPSLLPEVYKTLDIPFPLGKRIDTILEAVHETAKGLHKAGVMDQVTLREFDHICLQNIG